MQNIAVKQKGKVQGIEKRLKLREEKNKFEETCHLSLDPSYHGE